MIELAGPDACKLLQGLITNDVALLQQHPASEGGPMFTAFLTAKGVRPGRHAGRAAAEIDDRSRRDMCADHGDGDDWAQAGS